MMAQPQAAGRPARILIVDDERHNRALLETMLAPEGFLIQTAIGGDQALAMVAAEPPDLILLDLMMPGMDGHQVTVALKGNAATAHIPIIVVTALNDRPARLRGLGGGAEDFMSKPVDRAELSARVRGLLKLKAHGDYYDDYSRRLEAEAAARTAQLRFQDEFLSHVSHELRSPLTAIKQFSTILLTGLAGDLTPDQRHYQEIVLRNVAQLQAMIDDLLEGTRLEAGHVSIEVDSVSVPDAVRDVMDTMRGAAAAKDIAVSCVLAPDLPAAEADGTRVRQMLIILLDNAIKFSAPGGAVTITAGALADDPRYLVLAVCDTGCGISADSAERVFERLYQSAGPATGSRKGLGLGLYICKELVTRHGGRIWLESRLHHGSTFSFTLPIVGAIAATHPIPGETRQ